MRFSKNRRGTNQYQSKGVLLDSAICSKCKSVCSTAEYKTDEMVERSVEVVDSHIITNGIHKDCMNGIVEPCDGCMTAILINKKLNAILTSLRGIKSKE